MGGGGGRGRFGGTPVLSYKDIRHGLRGSTFLKVTFHDVIITKVRHTRIHFSYVRVTVIETDKEANKEADRIPSI